MQNSMSKPKNIFQRQPKWVQQLLSGLVGMLFGGAVGLLFGKAIGYVMPTGTPDYPGWQGIVLAVVIILPLLFLGVLLHELGHLVGGWIAGHRFAFLYVGPMALERQEGRLVWGWNKTPGFYGGMAGSLPDEHTRLTDTRRNMVKVIAGGPLASLLSTVLGAVALAFLPNHAPETETLAEFGLALTLVIFTGLSGLLTIVSATPYRTGGLYSDGARLRNYLGKSTEGQIDALYVSVYFRSLAGVRPRDWDGQALAQIESLPDDSTIARYARLGMYYHALDQGRIEAARQYLDYITDRLHEWPEPMHPSVWLERCFFEAWVHRDVAAARRWMPDEARLKRAMMIQRHKILLCQAAIAAAEDRHEEAARLASEGLQALRHPLDKGLAVMEREWLIALGGQN